VESITLTQYEKLLFFAVGKTNDLAMKRFAFLLLSWLPLIAGGQIIVDGNMNESAWRILGVSAGNSSFGPGNQLGVLKYHSNSTTLFIGITGKIAFNTSGLEVVPNIVLFLDLENYQGRGNAALGANMNGGVGPIVNNTPFRSGSTTCPNAPTPNGLSASIMDNDFDADYAFMINKGVAANTIYVDAVKFSNKNFDGTNPAYNAGPGNVGSSDIIGTTASFPINLGANWNTGSNALSFAYQDTYDPLDPLNQNKGIELSIPYAIIPTAAVGQRIRFFALITNNEGLASNVCIPGNPGTSNLGCGFNLSTNNFDPSNNIFFTEPWVTLPLSFLGLKAAWEGERVRLDWSVAEQGESNYYYIERSVDGIHFEPIGFLTAREQGSVSQYHFIDQSPLGGRNIYRVMARKRDGQLVYSKTVPIENQSLSPIHVFPNPAAEKVFIRMAGFAGSPCRWTLHNALGQPVLAGTLAMAQSVECLSLPASLPSGSYRLTLVSEGKIASRSLQVRR
jgi:hypothetical protein